jgi:hypothetical protein
VPLSEELGLPIHRPCTRTEYQCVAASVETFAASSTGNEGVLIVWAHSRMPKIARALGVHNPPSASTSDSVEGIADFSAEFPEAYNWVWVIENGEMISNTTNENCPGLDDEDITYTEDDEEDMHTFDLYRALQAWISPVAWWRY